MVERVEKGRSIPSGGEGSSSWLLPSIPGVLAVSSLLVVSPSPSHLPTRRLGPHSRGSPPRRRGFLGAPALEPASASASPGDFWVLGVGRSGSRLPGSRWVLSALSLVMVAMCVCICLLVAPSPRGSNVSINSLVWSELHCFRIN
jgi:hypothetical protein